MRNKHTEEALRVQLRDQLADIRKANREADDKLRAMLTFKQYQKLPVLVGLSQWLAAVKQVSRSKQVHAQADLVARLYEELRSASKAYNDQLNRMA